MVQPNIANLLKAVQGRDLFSGDINHLPQGVEFRFEGTVILIGNMPPDEALGNSSPLLDRFFVLHLRNVVNNRIEDFQNCDLERASQIVNWGLRFPEYLISNLARTFHISMCL